MSIIYSSLLEGEAQEDWNEEKDEISTGCEIESKTEKERIDFKR